MASSINSDNGVVSGSAGLKSSADSTGVLELQTNGTAALSISTAQLVSTTNGVTIQGLTVGRGAGAVSTNTAVGASALSGGSQSGGFNTVVGYQALLVNTTGAGNSAFGYGALSSNTTGGTNFAGGLNALLANTTGSNNIAIGRDALGANTTASNNTAVGYQAGYSNTTSSNNALFGYGAGYSSTGELNTFIGNFSGYSMTTGSKNTILGRFNGSQGGLDITTASNFIVLSDGDGNPRKWLNGSGYEYSPGIYNLTTASSANVHIDSSFAMYRSTSALKYKQDVRDLEEMDINLLRPVRYKSKCENDDQTKDHLGLIADEAAEAGFEELVTRGADGKVEGFQYERLTVVLLKELQTLRARVAQLEGN